LVVAEQKHGSLQPTTLHAVSAAQQLEGPITVLVAGHDMNGTAQAAAAVKGVEAVLVADDAVLKHGLAEPSAALLAKVQAKRGFSHILAPSSTFGRNLLPRAAALLDIQAIADVIEIKDERTFVRPIYAGNALAQVRALGDGPRLLTVRPTAFPAADDQGGSAKIESIEEEEISAAREAAGASEWIEESTPESARPELGQAKVVVAGGRALKSKDNFQMIERLADLLGGAVGASRAAVDAGFAPNDLQVGQTGKVVAPQLYIGIGISGAIQHIAGMKDSKCIVAINSDAEAPIFQVRGWAQRRMPGYTPCNVARTILLNSRHIP
jgi:electron transfer flavoprotein alpha subunit